ncbi:MAG TPA: patatin-like phospholipase family protein [Actinomycetota bacterium]|nr:patatin-like phospholipase family protein [Actinomycetota bacterium]
MGGGPSKRAERAFVLGGGGRLGACEVGMLRALFERGVCPDLIVGTSIGALNGAAVAVAPTIDTIERLEEIWTSLDKSEVFSGTLLSGARNLVRTRTSLQSNEPLRDLIERLLPAKTFADLTVPFQCVAASIERAAEHWFDDGPLVDAILASCAVPGILPPIEIDGEHFIDGGVVNSIPVARAVELGAREIFVLHVGRIERPLTVPRNPWQVGMVAFEVARRHRFARDIVSLPEGVVAHVLPAGETAPRFDSFEQLRYKNFKSIVRHIRAAHEASAAYLDGAGVGRSAAGA